MENIYNFPKLTSHLASIHFPSNIDDLIPMFGSTSGIVHLTEDYMIEQVPRHPAVQKVKGAFAMQVENDCMAPRHRLGERVYIHPRQVPSIGQDCVVIKEPDDGVPVLAQFMGETGSEWKFSQLNPVKNFTFEKSHVKKIYAVVR